MTDIFALYLLKRGKHYREKKYQKIAFEEQEMTTSTLNNNHSETVCFACVWYNMFIFILCSRQFSGMIEKISHKLMNKMLLCVNNIFLLATIDFLSDKNYHNWN